MRFAPIGSVPDTWIAVGAELARRGANVFFVMTRDEYVDEALAAGFDRQKILWLRRDEAEQSTFSQQDIELLEDYERATGERVRNFILMDRFMRSEDPDWAMQYCRYVFRALLDFIETNGIELVSGQPDDIPDLLGLMILRLRGGKYAAPFQFRLPEHQFVLWDVSYRANPSRYRRKIARRCNSRGTGCGSEFAAKVQKRREYQGAFSESATPDRPVILSAVNTRFFLSSPDRVASRRVHVQLEKHLLRPQISYDRDQLSPYAHAVAERFSSRVTGTNASFFFTLNYAPEHTIDVEAPHFVSPFETVRNMVRSLPSGVFLYVKEHPNALGIRSPSELFRIKRLPGVRLIDPFVDSHSLIKKAEAVVTLSGTASLEAAIYGKRTILLSDIFIKNFSTCERAEAPWEVGDILGRKPVRDYSEEGDLRYLAWLYSNSHPGSVIEPLTDPTSLEPENVGLVADAYCRLFASIASKCDSCCDAAG